MLYWLLKKVFLGPLLRVYYRPWAEGTEHVPKTGPAILAGNHLTVVDSFFMPLVLERKVTFLAKSDYFTQPGLKGMFKRAFFGGTGNVPVDRSGGHASEPAVRTALQVLSDGNLLGIYPEGTRSPDGRLYRGKTGVARMALEAKVPVIPVVMIGTAEMQPAGRLIPKRMRPGVRFGEPLDFSRYEGMERDRYVLRSVTDEVMYALMELSGQEYVDQYAASVKAKLASEQREKKAGQAD
ncbi:1-acyl-sn-glycerol-3-phosphate acyltransferase [Phytoactinopolyspora alkaliphila]|uniref:1-acyl-sn-glycerol-3-phosphate acyltransferase n=1 Tax=Phytoactinopolyspora alkaliphila TaxID=1783498 RepID=A0A6N9YTY6_9ACTN|nr:1-acyl-sn-glycerol-3-phosphate acyltransferase [Phytoactinopolyspora alkaliphila]